MQVLFPALFLPLVSFIDTENGLFKLVLTFLHWFIYFSMCKVHYFLDRLAGQMALCAILPKKQCFVLPFKKCEGGMSY
jgi:hypothetical protein